MARRRGNRLSRAFANLGGEAEPQVISRNLAINLNGADGVVCQVQNHAQSVDETIEVTVIPKRRLRRVIVRVEDDESSRDSSEPEVVVTTSKSGSGQNGRRQRQHRSNGRNDENIPPAGNSDGHAGHDGGDIPIRTAKNVTRDRRSKNRDDRSHHADIPTPTSSGSSANPHRPVHVPVDRPTRPVSMMAVLPSTGRGHRSTAELSSTSAQPLSARFDLASRISQLNPFKSSRATKDQPTDKGKSKDTGNSRQSKRHSEMYRNAGYEYGADHGTDHDSRCSKTPRAESSGSSTPGSYLDDYEHCCHSCERIRNSNFQKEHPVREGEKVRPNLCTTCRDKLEDGRSQVLGPRGENLSNSYWCNSCGCQRSTHYRIKNGPPGATELTSTNICSLCVRKARRHEEARRRREAELLESKQPPAKKTRDNNDGAESSRAHQQDNPPSASSTTFSNASTYLPDERRTNHENGERSVPSDFALAPAPTRRHRVPRASCAAAGPSQPRQDDTNDKARGKVKVDSTTRAAAAAAGRGSSRMAYNNNEAIQTEVDNGNGNDNDRRNVAATPPATAPVSVESQDDKGQQAEGAQPEGFIHNSAAAWAALDMDDVLFHAMTMDPAERAARRARLYGERPRRSSSSSPGSSVRGENSPVEANASTYPHGEDDSVVSPDDDSSSYWSSDDDDDDDGDSAIFYLEATNRRGQRLRIPTRRWSLSSLLTI
ncbi:hypothetical protein QBC37DRAFT_395317 [Rhypophila decipiens]|uniref:Uncharacterized protein n=1 Tax=Rhypophila decipiens TaxID=261697 RepID=A0AAN7BCB4_9PEZI|nr:hypothetical protein QBC37DRAFT_395317 [Rhypophila decipiens]